jgi:NAD(P)-dependent dehydrogenase (short-subunit alcohol dehydrogenase family)
MNIQSKTILITGANRGIGQALVNEALRPARRGSMPERVAGCKSPTIA